MIISLIGFSVLVFLPLSVAGGNGKRNSHVSSEELSSGATQLVDPRASVKVYAEKHTSAAIRDILKT